MASYYPEGECFFKRSSLKHPNGWTAEREDHFYSYVLIEYFWNGFVTINTKPNDYTHTRSKLVTGKGQWWNTTFCVWDRFFVGESVERDVRNMVAITSYRNSDNFNECRDRDKGGPLKYILRPIHIRNKRTQWLWIDGTVPIRAIYFPVSHKSEEAFQDYCTYVVIDLRARKNVTITNLSGQFATYTSTPAHGLNYNRDQTWGFNIPNIITYLTLPRQVRDPKQGLYRTAPRGDELFVREASRVVWRCPSSILHESRAFDREIDLARIVSATFGIEVGWRPYQFSTFILKLLQMVTELAVSFVPGVGPLLSVSFGIAMQVIADPDSFKADNVLDLSKAALEVLINSAVKGRKYIAPDLQLVSYNKLPEGFNAALTEDERKARKEAGEALNTHLTEIVHQMHGQDPPQSQAWLDRITDAARTAFADPVSDAHTEQELPSPAQDPVADAHTESELPLPAQDRVSDAHTMSDLPPPAEE